MATDKPKEVSLLEILASAFAVLQKNWLLSIALPILGVAAGAVYYSTSSDLWESGLLAKTSLLTRQEGMFLATQLEKVKRIPGISPEQFKQVRKLDFEVQSEPEERGLDDRSVYLEVTAQVSSREVFPVLERVIMDILNSSPAVVRYREERNRYYDQLIAKIDEEIAAMDQVKEKVSLQSQATFLNPSLLYSQTVDLYREKVKLEIRKEEISKVHLIKGFDSLSFERKIPLPVLLISGFILGILLLIVVLFLNYFIDYVKNQDRLE